VLTDATGKTYRVGEYLIVNGTTSQEVLYWYQMQGRSIANDYKAKLYTLVDSIRYARTDAALVRITSVVGPGEDRLEARKRVIDFAEQITPMLSAYVPN
jgi:EpsI family protein